MECLKDTTPKNESGLEVGDSRCWRPLEVWKSERSGLPLDQVDPRVVWGQTVGEVRVPEKVQYVGSLGYMAYIYVMYVYIYIYHVIFGTRVVGSEKTVTTSPAGLLTEPG